MNHGFEKGYRRAGRLLDALGSLSCFSTLAVAVLLQGCAQRADSGTPVQARTPILFVHGSGLDSGLWREMMDGLLSSGYSAEELLAVDLVPKDGSNPRAARLLIAPAVERLLAQAREAALKRGQRPSQRIDIVAHSMGAVSSRWYAAFIRPDLVRLWLGVAAANHGTDALCGFPGEGDRELCPAFARSGSANPVQVRLNGTPERPLDVSPYGLGNDVSAIKPIPAVPDRCIAYFTVRLAVDEWIKPESSAELDGAGGWELTSLKTLPFLETKPGNFLFQAETTHDELPRHPAMIDFVGALVHAADEHWPSRCGL